MITKETFTYTPRLLFTKNYKKQDVQFEWNGIIRTAYRRCSSFEAKPWHIMYILYYFLIFTAYMIPVNVFAREVNDI